MASGALCVHLMGANPNPQAWEVVLCGIDRSQNIIPSAMECSFSPLAEFPQTSIMEPHMDGQRISRFRQVAMNTPQPLMLNMSCESPHTVDTQSPAWP